jgi:anti-anti-sigma factor
MGLPRWPHLTDAALTLLLVLSSNTTSDVKGVFYLVSFCLVILYLMYVSVSILCSSKPSSDEPALLPTVWDREIDEGFTLKPKGWKHIRVSDDDDVAVVSFVDIAEATRDFDPIEEVGRELYDLVDLGQRSRLVLDFGNVEFIPWAAFKGKLLSLQRKVQRAGGSLKMCNLHPSIMESFRICSLDRVLVIYPTLEEALCLSMRVRQAEDESRSGAIRGLRLATRLNEPRPERRQGTGGM